MENKLEQLLNSLIKKGWKPFGRKVQCIRKSEQFIGKWVYCGLNYQKRVSLRELTSKESGLWQFVCENGMIAGYDTSEHYINYRRFNKEDFTECRYLREHQYRLIESSLKDESELEDFLLQNIKVGRLTRFL